MINATVTWWINQLATLIRQPLGQANAKDKFVAEMEPAALVVTECAKRGGVRQLRLSFDISRNLVNAVNGGRPPVRVLLRAPSTFLLEREVVLPLAVERDWRSALRYEMTRLTPFSADQLFWDGKIIRRDATQGLTLRLSMIRREALALPIETLRKAGFIPSAIEVTSQTGGLRRIALSADLPTGRSSRRQIHWLAASCAVLTMTAIILPFLFQWLQAAAVEEQIALLQPKMTQVDALRQIRASGTRTAGILAQARAQTGDPLAALAAVTNALPDGSYLTALTLNHLQLTLVGQSAAAAALLPALSANYILTNVAFSAPVTRDATSHQDLFTIQAQVLPQ